LLADIRDTTTGGEGGATSGVEGAAAAGRGVGSSESDADGGDKDLPVHDDTPEELDEDDVDEHGDDVEDAASATKSASSPRRCRFGALGFGSSEQRSGCHSAPKMKPPFCLRRGCSSVDDGS